MAISKIRPTTVLTVASFQSIAMGFEYIVGAQTFNQLRNLIKENSLTNSRYSDLREDHCARVRLTPVKREKAGK